MERMLKELEELKAQAFETRKESDRHDSYYEGINQAVDIVKNCTIHGVTQQSELLAFEGWVNKNTTTALKDGIKLALENYKKANCG